jgi:hypothetical protein
MTSDEDRDPSGYLHGYSADERDRLTAQLRQQVEQGAGVWRMATAYLAATKPA